MRAYTSFRYQFPSYAFRHDTGAALGFTATLADGTALAAPDDDTNTHWLKFDAAPVPSPARRGVAMWARSR